MIDAKMIDLADAEPINRSAIDVALDPEWSRSEIAPAAASRAKRVFDIAFAAAALLVFLPILVVAAVLIKLETPGPILFRQRRTGLNGEVFTILKMRTMRVTEDSHVIAHATKNDARVTRIGALLRKTSLDEIPQLLNVLSGDMSIVGPRPHAIAHDLLYSKQIDSYPARFRVRPGLTGLAQISGLRGEIHSLDDMSLRIDADNLYIEQWTFGLDVSIAIKTIRVFFFDHQAY